MFGSNDYLSQNQVKLHHKHIIIFDNFPPLLKSNFARIFCKKKFLLWASTPPPPNSLLSYSDCIFHGIVTTSVVNTTDQLCNPCIH